jgi:hypothetical protein
MAETKSNFHPLYRTFAMLADDELGREVKDSDFGSIRFMNERELLESIVHDILWPTIWEMEKSESVCFDAAEFLRFVPRAEDREMITDMMGHVEIAGLIEHKDGQLRIKKDRAILQAAMDYCGVWAHGFDMPPDALVTNFEAVGDAIEQHGSIENFAAALMMDMNSTVPSNDTLQ